uniref:RxLR effector protein n=1 Tax=Sclerospora graminicola TaxID=162130 RepID=A0A9E8S7C3_9STRA|nr:RxLR-dEER protein_60945 [Sclerospora graminicola]
MRSVSILFLVLVAFLASGGSALDDHEVNEPTTGHAITGYYHDAIPAKRLLRTRKTRHDEERMNPLTNTLANGLSKVAWARLQKWKKLHGPAHVLKKVRIGDPDITDPKQLQENVLKALKKTSMEGVVAYFADEPAALVNVLHEHYGLNAVVRVLLAVKNDNNGQAQQVKENAEKLRHLIIKHWMQTDESYSNVFSLLLREVQDFPNWRMLDEFISRKTRTVNNDAVLFDTLKELFQTEGNFVSQLNRAEHALEEKTQKEEVAALETRYLSYLMDRRVSINGFIERMGLEEVLPDNVLPTIVKFSNLRFKENPVNDYGKFAILLWKMKQGRGAHRSRINLHENVLFEHLLAQAVEPNMFALELLKAEKLDTFNLELLKAEKPDTFALELLKVEKPDFMQTIANKYKIFYEKNAHPV